MSIKYVHVPIFPKEGNLLLTNSALEKLGLKSLLAIHPVKCLKGNFTDKVKLFNGVKEKEENLEHIKEIKLN